MTVSRHSLRDSYLAASNSGAVVRARMAASAPRQRVRRGESSRALARALLTTAAGRVRADEREWIERIEARRDELAARQGSTRADFAPQRGGLPGWAVAFDRLIPLWGATEMLSIPPLWGRFLLRLVREVGPRSCVELGTAFGISTAFQAAALELRGSGRIVTVDAAREWAAMAEEGWDALGLSERIAMRIGHIGDVLDEALADAAPIDFAFVDAEHQEEPTVDYFERLVPHLSSRALVVFDDIGFPLQMRRAWQRIKRDPRVRSSVSLSRMGVVAVG